jgi:anti-anti-sigma factor
MTQLVSYEYFLSWLQQAATETHVEIAKHLVKSTLHITLSGKFTFSDHREYRKLLDELAEAEINEINFHLECLDFVDSAALGMLLLALDVAESKHKRLVLSGATGQVKRMFDLSRFNTLFVISS